MKIVSSQLDLGSQTKVAESAFNKFMDRKDIGFPFIPERTELWQQAQQLGHHLRSKYQKMIIVGIGGSSLGPKVIHELAQTNNIDFMDNVDPIKILSQLNLLLNLTEVVWVFISKSGTTIETLATLEFVSQYYNQKGLKLESQSVVVTELKQSSLFNWALKNNIPILEIPFDVGGRFSVLSSVGLLPAAFLGLDLEKIKRGAIKALQDKNSIVEVSAHLLQSFERQEWITQLWNYNSRLFFFGQWFQQLWAESLAKKINLHGEKAARVSSPFAAVGACDQHSILQQVMEGAKDKFVIFQRFYDSETEGFRLHQCQFPETKILTDKKIGQLLSAELLATQEAMENEGIHTLRLEYDHLNEECLGYLFMFWQMVVATIGESLEINTFNQPGVELGKVLAKRKLD